MHVIFENSAKICGHKELPYKQSIDFAPVFKSFALNGARCKGREEWVHEATRVLKALGIKDWGYTFGENDKGVPRATFHFHKEMDMMRFLAIALGDTHAEFERNVYATTKAELIKKWDLILQYIAANEIKADMKQISPTHIRITTHRRYDDQAIYTHLLQGGFNVGRITSNMPVLGMSPK